METVFKNAYNQLNDAQLRAVDYIDGPLMVLAGPGTGKTQLLSVRVANIIKQTDTSPSNILCLTFTDNAARNMRERLQSIIGQASSHVAVQTFHSFGSEIIVNNPDYFLSRKLTQQIDELGRYEIMHDLFEGLPLNNPLSSKLGDDYLFLKDTLSTISYLKQNAITPPRLQEILQANKHIMDSLSELVAETFATKVSTKELRSYKKLLKAIRALSGSKQPYGFPDYATVCADQLELAINSTDPSKHYATLITAWRNEFCGKDDNNQHVFKDAGKNYQKMVAVGKIYQQMIDSMAEKGLYDFDDMIVEVVSALEDNADLRLTLQERYQYILVDEFQDTNKAQLKMLTSLGDNPLFEQRPNIMVVGDDDQAIYAFQGAEVSNMLSFAGLYKDVKIISLKDNYRSTEDILQVSGLIAKQITDRLESILPITSKELSAKKDFKVQQLQHDVFASELAQYDFIARSVRDYIAKGMNPEQIAILSPKHRYLERLLPYLGEYHIPIAYERSDDILDSPIIIQLLTMTKLIVALANNAQNQVDTLFGHVLSYEFWEIDPVELINISLNCYDHHEHWLSELLKSKNPKIKNIVLWFNQLAETSDLEPLEYILDQLMGEDKLPKDVFSSPMRRFHFNSERYKDATDRYLELLGQIATLRQRLRLWQPNSFLKAEDFVTFSNLHKQAKLKIVDDNPHTQTTNAVQLMTAYKAKGLEFEVVFVINAQDEVWGPRARSRSSLITLPHNLPIEPAGSKDNDKLRLLYVAMTRAKHDLVITSYSHNLDSKLSTGLSFIGGNSPDSEVIDPRLRAKSYPKATTAEAIEILSTDWAYRFHQVIADEKQLLEPILKTYKLSVTHLNNFIDVRDKGPNYFLMHSLLRFPESASPSAAYGDSIHKTLQWVYSLLRKDSKLPTQKLINEYFSDVLIKKHLRPNDYTAQNERGISALTNYITKRGSGLKKTDIIERGFGNDGVLIGEAHLSGKIDKIQIDANIAHVIDFKTGKPVTSWQPKDPYEKVKLHLYRNQLMFYKLLIEHSASYAKKIVVNSGALEFIEPGENGQLIDDLHLDIDPEELRRFTALVEAVWTHIQNLDLPDISAYKKDLSGVEAFEQDLINSPR
jgi:DNA helicase-2/ATP-dependent DNA helicase PcrA